MNGNGARIIDFSKISKKFYYVVCSLMALLILSGSILLYNTVYMHKKYLKNIKEDTLFLENTHLDSSYETYFVGKGMDENKICVNDKQEMYGNIESDISKRKYTKITDYINDEKQDVKYMVLPDSIVQGRSIYFNQKNNKINDVNYNKDIFNNNENFVIQDLEIYNDKKYFEDDILHTHGSLLDAKKISRIGNNKYLQIKIQLDYNKKEGFIHWYEKNKEIILGDSMYVSEDVEIKNALNHRCPSYASSKSENMSNRDITNVENDNIENTVGIMTDNANFKNDKLVLTYPKDVLNGCSIQKKCKNIKISFNLEDSNDKLLNGTRNQNDSKHYFKISKKSKWKDFYIEESKFNVEESFNIKSCYEKEELYISTDENLDVNNANHSKEKLSELSYKFLNLKKIENRSNNTKNKQEEFFRQSMRLKTDDICNFHDHASFVFDYILKMLLKLNKKPLNIYLEIDFYEPLLDDELEVYEDFDNVNTNIFLNYLLYIFARDNNYSKIIKRASRLSKKIGKNLKISIIRGDFGFNIDVYSNNSRMFHFNLKNKDENIINLTENNKNKNKSKGFSIDRDVNFRENIEKYPYNHESSNLDKSKYISKYLKNEYFLKETSQFIDPNSSEEKQIKPFLTEDCLKATRELENDINLNLEPKINEEVQLNADLTKITNSEFDSEKYFRFKEYQDSDKLLDSQSVKNESNEKNNLGSLYSQNEIIYKKLEDQKIPPADTMSNEEHENKLSTIKIQDPYKQNDLLTNDGNIMADMKTDFVKSKINKPSKRVYTGRSHISFDKRFANTSNTIKSLNIDGSNEPITSNNEIDKKVFVKNNPVHFNIQKEDLSENKIEYTDEKDKTKEISGIEEKHMDSYKNIDYGLFKDIENDKVKVNKENSSLKKLDRVDHYEEVDLLEDHKTKNITPKNIETYVLPVGANVNVEKDCLKFVVEDSKSESFKKASNLLKRGQNRYFSNLLKSTIRNPGFYTGIYANSSAHFIQNDDDFLENNIEKDLSNEVD